MGQFYFRELWSWKNKKTWGQNSILVQVSQTTDDKN